MASHHYLATALPPLGEPGSAPTLSLPELRAQVAESSAAALVDAILLADDLRQRQACLAGELAEPDPAVLERAQASGSAPLPEALSTEGGFESHRSLEDQLWEAYWRHAAAVARTRRSAFLRGWVGAEVALRNGVAAARAEALGRPPAPLLVAPELGDPDRLVEIGLAEWGAAPDPLAGLRALLRARWDWVTRAEPRFTFEDDELAAYAVKLMLLRDWQRTAGVAA